MNLSLQSETVRQSARPLCIDLFCGLGGWADGFLAEGYDVIGFDIERHDYGTSGYPGQLVLQDVLTLDGRQFRNAAVIVASPPCQAYSYRNMPWGALWREHNRMDDDGAPAGNYRGKDPIFNDLFHACFRIAREAGLPVVVENVKGAQRFVGPAVWSYRSFFLWGDVPALMPIPSGSRKVQIPGWNRHSKGKGFNVTAAQDWKNAATNGGSSARKAASAQIAKIPFPLAQHIARVFKP